VELLLIRHGLPVRRELESGAADPELAPEGRAQAEHMAKYLASESIDAIYASPMRRAAETAAPLAAVFGLEIVVDDGVAEYDQHSSEYIPIEELKRSGDPRFHEFANGLGDDHEDFDVFASRVMASLDRIISDHPSQTVAVVCHGGVINLFLARVLGLDFEPPGFFYPNYTSIHRVGASRSGVRSLLAVNETAHLRGTGLDMSLFRS
jgi:probable phosphoglycerate mutase